MRRSFLLLSSSLLVACSGGDVQGNIVPADQDAAVAARIELNQVSPSEETSGARELVPARFYVDPVNNRVDLAVIRENTEPTATMNGHYSQAMVSCGIACMSYWIVDRNTGAVIDVPARPDSSGTEEIEVIHEIKGRIDSDIVEVTYGPMDSLSDNSCKSQHFRLSGNTLSPTGGSSEVTCPGPGHRR